MVTITVFDVTTDVPVVFPGFTGAVAVIITCPSFVVGTAAGAVNWPTFTSVVVGTIVPVAGLPPLTPFTRKVTAVVVFVVDVPFVNITVAVKSAIVFTGTLADDGESVIPVIVPLAPLPPLLHAGIPTINANRLPTSETPAILFRIPLTPVESEVE